MAIPSRVLCLAFFSFVGVYCHWFEALAFVCLSCAFRILVLILCSSFLLLLLRLTPGNHDITIPKAFTFLHALVSLPWSCGILCVYAGGPSLQKLGLLSTQVIPDTSWLFKEMNAWMIFCWPGSRKIPYFTAPWCWLNDCGLMYCVLYMYNVSVHPQTAASTHSCCRTNNSSHSSWMLVFSTSHVNE